MVDRSQVLATTPLEKKPPKVGNPKMVAAGIPAITSSMKHGLSRMGSVRSIRTLRMVNQKSGFDCPGCAWPDPDDHRTTFEFCENGAKAVADEAMKKRIGPPFFRRNDIVSLSHRSDHWLNAQGRLTTPMYLPPDSMNYEPISWDAAFDLICGRLKESEADRSVFYTSGRTSNEAAFLYQLLVRRHGTNNLPDCSNMCHESSGRGLGETIGIGKGTVTLEDFNKADLIIVMGQNPGTNHPRMLTALRDAKRKGSRIIHVNPLPETGLVSFKHPQDYMRLKFGKDQLADLFLQVKVNGDAALLKGMMKIIKERDGLDHSFIDDYCSGFEAFTESLETISWDDIVRDSGLTREEIEIAGDMCNDSGATIICWAMGLTQQENAVATIQEVVNLLLMGGHIGRPGAGPCPVRGHSNVQGDRTMGIWERPSESFLQGVEKAVGFTMPREHGLDVVDSIRAMRDGEVDVFMCMGGNFLSATPDTEATAAALRNVGLTIQISTKLNRSHLITGKEALILPCLGRTERDVQESGPQFVSVENSMGVVHSSTGRLKPASQELRSEVSIISSLGVQLYPDAVDWLGLSSDYSRIRNLISESIPGFEDYDARVRVPGGFNLPNPPRDSRTFNTEDGKARFTSHPLPRVEPVEGDLVMITIRSHDQYNTTIYDLDDRYRGIKKGRRIVLMNKEDMQERGLDSGSLVDITSYWRGEVRRADSFRVVEYSIPRGNVATYFPESNVLVPLDSTAAKSNTPTSKFIEVRIEASS